LGTQDRIQETLEMANILASRNNARGLGRAWARWLDGSGTAAMLAAVIAVIAFAACETIAGTHAAGAAAATLPVAE
jgi:hypothetical protein